MIKAKIKRYHKVGGIKREEVINIQLVSLTAFRNICEDEELSLLLPLYIKENRQGFAEWCVIRTGRGAYIDLLSFQDWYADRIGGVL